MSKVAEQAEKRVFEHDGVKYAVLRPKMDQITEANKLSREVFNEELNEGSLLRTQLDTELRKRQLWSDDREAEYQLLRKEIVDGEYALAVGGIKLSEAKDLALEMKKKRREMVEMLTAKSELDNNTCEGKADAARFNYLVATSLVYEESGEPYFKNGLADYILKQDDPVSERAASEFFYLISDTEQSDDDLPENKFLKQFNFVNDKAQLIDADGKLVDSEGRHINEEGRYIKWTGDDAWIYVDESGREIDEDGNFVVKFTPFVDDINGPVKPKKRVHRKKAPASE